MGCSFSIYTTPKFNSKFAPESHGGFAWKTTIRLPTWVNESADELPSGNFEGRVRFHESGPIRSQPHTSFGPPSGGEK